MVNASSTEDDAPPPYSALSMPVYSLSSLPGPEDVGLPSDPTLRSFYQAFSESRPSLNITTYTSPVAIKPVRMFSLGLYIGTMTWRNVRQSKRVALQILTKEMMTPQLFEILGRKSSRNMNKLPVLRESHRLIDWKGYTIFEDAFGVMLLEVVGDFSQCGDHDVALCRVTDWETLSPGRQPLYTADLRAQGLIP